MSTDQTDRAIAAIDAVLTDDQIDDIVDWQLSRYDERTGYDYNVGQAPCGHCAREEHGLAITERIEHMRLWGEYDETYRYDEDTTPILCPGTYVPGPVGFRHAHEREQRARGARFWFDHDDAREDGRQDRVESYRYPVAEDRERLAVLLNDGQVRYIPHQTISFNIEAMEQFREQWRREAEELRERWNSIRTGRWETIRAGAPYWTFTVGDTGPWEITRPPDPQPVGALTVRLIAPDGRPIPLARHVRAHQLQPTDTGFSVELDLPPRGRCGAVRDRGPGSRIILEGPGGQRERIAGTVTAVALNADGSRFVLDVASEHHHLPSVYAEPEETR
ncbi:hypothetical protein TPA4_79 [Tsukamurella phage TPA4]|uniref:hypothetical protein n=1 Tax=Tsukamurella phage TPA4 TaxID=1647476 RepID=UPI0007B6550D|nr:hypothetical protein BH784_gp79 [Tsukamurella phage TPA4]AKJ72244.1 hypothetical protein TPA4_79 [Tsukamurella phage TPA4]